MTVFTPQHRFAQYFFVLFNLTCTLIIASNFFFKPRLSSNSSVIKSLGYLAGKPS